MWVVVGRGKHANAISPRALSSFCSYRLPRTMPAPPQTVLIVGGGEYGLSAALALAEGPYSSAPSLITVLDRSASPPSLDAASSDINKVRS